MKQVLPYNSRLKELAKKLRNNSTYSEVLLWMEIKGKKLGVEFHRQVPIDEFIVDFYCHELKLVIEIDGSSHDFEEVFVNDVERQKRLETFGIQFVRFEDLEVKKQMSNVLAELELKIREIRNIPQPPSKGEALPASNGENDKKMGN